MPDSARSFCPHCGGLCPAFARFCPHCGGAVEGALRRESVEPAKQPEVAPVPPLTGSGDSSSSTQESPVASHTEDVVERQLIPATPGKRLAAGLVDVLLALMLMQLLLRSRTFGALRWRAFFLFCIPTLYMILKDSVAGKSVGKFLMGLTTYNVSSRKPGDFANSVLRNWFFFVLILPPYIPVFRFLFNPGMLVFCGLAIIIAAQIALGGGRRLGDGLANTLVVEDRLNGRR